MRIGIAEERKCVELFCQHDEELELPIEFRAGAGAVKNSQSGGNEIWRETRIGIAEEGKCVELFRQHDEELKLPIEFRAGDAIKNSNRGETRIGSAEERSV
jgi:hypothetical protein